MQQEVYPIPVYKINVGFLPGNQLKWKLTPNFVKSP